MERDSNILYIRATTFEPLLGTTPGNPELATDYQAAKHPIHVQADEAALIAEREQQAEDNPDFAEELKKLSTIFPRIETDTSVPGGRPFIWNYQLKGLLKGNSESLVYSDLYLKETLKKLRLTPYLHKKTIDTQVFVRPRRIPIMGDYVVTTLERPLRGQTMKGERITLARSEMIPKGVWFVAEIKINNSNLMDWIHDCLDYAEDGGFLQWRNSTMGAFTWEELTADQFAEAK